MLRRIAEFGQVGRDPAGGVTRLALTDADREGRDRFVAWLKAASLEVRVDDGGNITGLTPAGEDPPILVGSHLDSVRSGGPHDGVLGVTAGLGVVEALAGATRHRLGAVAFTGEEGARFRPALLGSALAVGAIPPADLHARRDDDGQTFGHELRRIGYLGSAANRPNRAAAYLELHVEQGPVLEHHGARLGVVQGIIGMRWYEVRVAGAAGHAGASPMAARRDALAAAARMIVAVQEVATASDDALLATVGRCRVEPDVQNVIPAMATFSLDLRGADPAELDAGEQRLRARFAQVAADQGCDLQVAVLWDSPPVAFDAAVRAAITEAATALGVHALPLWSGPSHDARMMATVAPAGMIFVPSLGGVSHSPHERTADADLALGARALLEAVRRLDGQLPTA